MVMRPEDTPSTHIEAPGREALTNKDYWDKLDQFMAALPEKEQTIGAAINFMLLQGNKDYFEKFPYLNKKYKVPSKDTPKFTMEEISHEIAHIVTRSGHTPQMEHTALPFDMGMTYGAYSLGHASAEEIKLFKDHRKSLVIQYKHMGRAYQDEMPPEASKTNWAVELAAGLYLREKLDVFAQSGLLDTAYDYAEQKLFSESYRGKDSAHTLTPKQSYDWEALLNAPYDFIKLSKQERRAITAVALGIHEPEATFYPERLKPIKEALIKTGLFFDKPKFTEEIKRQQLEKDKGSDVSAGNSK